MLRRAQLGKICLTLVQQRTQLLDIKRVFTSIDLLSVQEEIAFEAADFHCHIKQFSHPLPEQDSLFNNVDLVKRIDGNGHGQDGDDAGIRV